MGIFDSLRRWWTGEGLPQCFLCKAGIRRRDIDRGKALVLGRQPYCRKCVVLFTSKPPGEGGALADSSSHAAKA